MMGLNQNHPIRAMNVIFGQSDLDIYLPENKIFPGGGALNIAYHWRQLGVPFTLLTRIADDKPDYFLDFYERHGVLLMQSSLIKQGKAGSSDIYIRPDGDVFMDNWIEGVGADIELDAAEMGLIGQAKWLHTFLIDSIVAQLKRLSALGYLATTAVSGDFFDFSPFDLVTFREAMEYIDIGFIGWQMELTDETMVGIRAIVQDLGKMLIVTLGSRGVMVYDGRSNSPLNQGQGDGLGEQFFPVEAIPVEGSTIGCGDAFAAYFLAEWQRSQNISKAVNAGNVGGRKATQWRRCLPDKAYGLAS